LFSEHLRVAIEKVWSNNQYEQKKIVEDLCSVLSDALQTESVQVFLHYTTLGSYRDPRDEEQIIPQDDPFLLALSRQQDPIVREELLLKEQDTGAIQLATTLAEYQSEICVPLRTQDRLTGFLFLGKKRNRDIFSVQDLHLLSTLGTQVAVALENARLYEELRASHVMLARNDRLAAVGTLAAGIAHEIRNPLVAVHTFAQLLPEKIDDPEFRTTFMELTTSELERVSTLVNDLLAFSRPFPSLLNEVQLNDLAQQAIRLLAGQAKKKSTTLTTHLASDLLPLLVDQEQIKQVLMNLMMNALQATKEKKRSTSLSRRQSMWFSLICACQACPAFKSWTELNNSIPLSRLLLSPVMPLTIRSSKDSVCTPLIIFLSPSISPICGRQ